MPKYDEKKNDELEATEVVAAAKEPEVKEPPKPFADPHAGLVKMHKDGKHINANPSVVKEHEKNGWKVA